MDSECAFVGLPARVARVLLLPSSSYETPDVFPLHLDAPILPTAPDLALGEDVEACCGGDGVACDEFSYEVDESLVNVTTLDIVAHRERSPPIDDDAAMLGGPSFVYCECGDESRTRTNSAAQCTGGEESASFLHVYAEFVVSGRRYRLLEDRQWDGFSVVPPRVERLERDWVLVDPSVERNTEDEECPRHHYRGGGFGAYWSADANVLVVGYALEGPSQSFCQPGIHYAAYAL